MQARWPLFAVAPIAMLHACSRDPSSSGGPESGGDGGAASPDGAASAAGDASPGSDAASRDAGEAGADGGKPGELFAFVGSTDGKVRVYSVDAASGAWTFKKESSAGTNPSFLAFDPPRRRVVAVDEIDAGLVRSFAFDPQSGALTERNTKASGGAAPTHLSIAPGGSWVFVANYTGGTASVFPLDATGLLGDASDTKASGPKSHWAGTDSSGAYAFVPALGADSIAQYKFDGATGKLTDNGVAAVPAGAGPRHLGFHPSEKWAYVMNELAVSVTTLDLDKATGKLAAKQTISALPPGQSAAGVTGAEIVVHPSGKHVYASSRQYDSIVHFTVDAANGTLTRVANVTTGAGRPRSFGVDPEGTLLYAGNADAAHVVGFRIDGASGALTPLGKTVDVPAPSYVGLARMP
jgi:6-phosphogluconolactonase